MTTTNFVDGTIIEKEWLNDVDDFVYTFPTQVGNTGKYLTTNGTIMSWDEVLGSTPTTLYIDPRDPSFDGGAVAEEVDSTTKFQAALTYAKTVNGVVIVPQGIYNVGALNILNGVRGFIGVGGTLKLIDTGANPGIRLLGTTPGGAAANVSNCLLSDLVIDANNTSTDANPIWCQNVDAVTIRNCTITNMAKGIGILVRIYEGVNSGGGCRIQNNKVFGILETDSTVKNWDGIEVGTSIIYNPTYTGAAKQYKNIHLAPCNSARMTATGTAYNAGNVISGNYVYGAFYGLSHNGLSYSTITGNFCYNNIRGIVVDHTSNGNTISGNLIVDCLSAGIHLSYGSTYNSILNNKVYTTRGTIEALLQAYVGCKYNTFQNNVLESFAAVGPRAGCYTAVDCTANKFIENSIRGNFFQAGISVESDWDTTTGETLSYAYGKAGEDTVDTPISALAAAQSQYVVFKNNILEMTNASCAAIYIGQFNAINIRRCRYEGNAVLHDDSNITLAWQLRAYSAAGTFAGFEFIDNAFDSQTSSTYDSIFISVAIGFLYENRNNTWLTGARTAEVLTRQTSAGTTRSVNFATPVVTIGCAYAKFTNSAATLVTDFSGGENGQEMNIKLDVYTAIKHTAGTIVLKDGVSIYGTTYVGSPTAWANATPYVAGDVRSNGGLNYYCILAHTSATGTKEPPNKVYWEKCTNGDNWISFKRETNIWYETGRNW